MNKSIGNNLCTSCGACIQGCPKQCITFSLNEYMERVPTINEAECIHCGYCERVCHLNKETSIDINNITSYACISKNKETMKQVSSGGAFDAISRYVLSQKGVVYGCAYQNHLEVKHIKIDSLDDLPLLYGSKYVQSDVGETYLQARKDLKDGILVLYSGTPCQIAGLKSFLGTDYDNLITVDLICHGTPPATYFNKYVSGYEKKHNVFLDKIAFRDKRNNSSWVSGYIYGNKNGKKYTRKMYYFDNWYYFYFLQGSTYNEACYGCKYANLKRQSDFTLGDLWGSEKFHLPFNDTKGCSLVLVNTPKAKNIFSNLSLEKYSVPLKEVCKYNGQLVYPTSKPQDCEALKKDICQLNFEQIQKNFKRKYRMAISFGKIKVITPRFIKKYIKRLK